VRGFGSTAMQSISLPVSACGWPASAGPTVTESTGGRPVGGLAEAARAAAATRLGTQTALPRLADIRTATGYDWPLHAGE
jgi:hypothetical protein